ncbi:hypothetical protein [Mucilaginibacter sp.]
MRNAFEIDVPMKDRPVVIMVTPRENESNVFDLSYCNEPCGCIFCNENNVWIYEPHAPAALLFDEVQIKHLGAAIGAHLQQQ